MDVSAYTQRQMANLRSENRTLRTEYARMKARIAQLELEAMLHQQRDREDVAWLQAKVVRQRRALGALNAARNIERIRNGDAPVPDVETDIINEYEVREAQVTAAAERAVASLAKDEDKA